MKTTIIKASIALLVCMLYIWTTNGVGTAVGATAVIPDEFVTTGEFTEPIDPYLVSRYIEISSLAQLTKYVKGEAELSPTLSKMEEAMDWAVTNSDARLVDELERYKDYAISNDSNAKVVEQLLDTHVDYFLTQHFLSKSVILAARIFTLFTIVILNWLLCVKQQTCGRRYTPVEY